FKLDRYLMCILEQRVSHTSTHLMVALSATQIPLSKPVIPSGLILRETRIISSNLTLASVSLSLDEETETVLVSLRTEKSIREVLIPFTSRITLVMNFPLVWKMSSTMVRGKSHG
ncbi:hypothetical protein MKW92_052339, partial [Papaver armeniacum]